MLTWSQINEEVRKSGGVVQPAVGDVHVNRPLTNISVAYMQSADQFVADRVFPNISVPKKSDSYFTFDREAWLRSQMKERAAGTEAETATFMVDTDTYNAKVWALKTFLPDEVRANTDSPIMLDRASTDFLTLQALLQREKRFADNYLKTSVWTLEADGAASDSTTFDGTSNKNVAYWNDYSASGSSDPIENVRTFKRTVQKRVGGAFRPNVAVFSRKIVDSLLEHPDIIDRLNRGQTSGPARANMDDLMRLLELDDILVMESIEATNALGTTAVYNFINENDGLLLYRPASAGLMIPSAGYTFSWTGYVGAGPAGNRIRRYRVESRKSDCIEIEAAYDFKQVSADLGLFLNGIVQ